jgi:hypothetical protein
MNEPGKEDLLRIAKGAEDRIQELEHLTSRQSRYLVIGLGIFCVALIVDIWAIVALGNLYRTAGDLLIGGSILVTVLGPFMLYSIYKDGKSSLEKLNKYRRSMEKYHQKHDNEIVSNV